MKTSYAPSMTVVSMATLIALLILCFVGLSHAMMGPGTMGPGGTGWHQSYNGFTVDTSGDLFINPQRFGELTGHILNWVDEDGDGICDYAQNTSLFQNLGIGPFVDDNGDGIHDAFQTHGFYAAMGLHNFVDVDGDGICDNYELDPLGPNGPGNALGGHVRHQFYADFDVDTSGDVFVNRERLRLLFQDMVPWVDDDGDGILDYVEDMPAFHGLGVGPFVDANGDGIHDAFQTRGFYRAAAMMNYVDTDGDGLCDNYVDGPTGPGGNTMMGGNLP